jgi:hypothetical protein
VPNGWAEFLEQAKRQVASEEQTALHAIWSEFVQRSQASPRAEGLQLLIQTVQKAPVDQRASVAVVIAALLEPLEWPLEWEQHRRGLAEALVALGPLMNPKEPSSLPALLEPRPEEGLLLAAGFFMLSCAARLLITCRRDELRMVAHLCDGGFGQSTMTLRLILARKAGKPLEGASLQARMRWDAAVERYAQAARALNSAAGEVFFTYLDERLGGLET